MRESINMGGFTQVDNFLLDHIIPTLSLPAQSVFLRIWRQIVGWQSRSQESDKISHTQFTKYTGIQSHNTINKAIDELKYRELVHVEEHGTNPREFFIRWDTLTKLSELYRTQPGTQLRFSTFNVDN
jgi:hypothetical protein